MFLYLIIFVITLLIIFKILPSKSRNHAEPPSVPWALPVLGHLLYLRDFPCKTLMKWKKIYGPTFFVQFGSYRTLVFHDVKVLKEAYNVNALNDRPPFKQYTDATQNKGFLYCNKFHEGKQQVFLQRVLELFSHKDLSLETYCNDEMTKLLDVIALKQGKAYPIEDMFVYIIVNPICTLSMGYRFQPGDPELLKLTRLIHRIVEKPSNVESLGMYLPWLSNLLPGITQVNSWVAAYKSLVAFIDDKLQDRKLSRIPNQPRDIADAYTDETEKTSDPSSTFYPAKNFMPQAMAELLVTVGDNSAIMEWVILLLAKYQEVQKKLREEILQGITNSRHPCVSDRKNMPYTEAVISEVLRFSSFVPFSFPHFSSEDIQLNDIFIPKNTMLLQNTYGIQNDPEYWDEPEEFRPERFIDENGKYKDNENLVIFGCGKRLCIGKDIAEDQLFIFVTRIFQRFHVRFGEKIANTNPRCFSFVLHPEPFDAIFTETN